VRTANQVVYSKYLGVSDDAYDRAVALQLGKVLLNLLLARIVCPLHRRLRERLLLRTVPTARP